MVDDAGPNWVGMNKRVYLHLPRKREERKEFRAAPTHDSATENIVQLQHLLRTFLVLLAEILLMSINDPFISPR